MTFIRIVRFTFSLGLLTRVSAFAVYLACLCAALSAQVTNPVGYTFGTVSLGNSATTTVTFSFTGAVTVGSVSVVTGGATGKDFQATSPDTNTTLCTARTYSSGQSCTVDITFAPLAPGLRTGAAILRNATNQIVGTAYVKGLGAGAQLGYTAPAVSTFLGMGTYSVASPVGLSGTAAGLVQPSQIAFDGAGNMYLDDGSYHHVIYKVTPQGLVSVAAGTYGGSCNSQAGVTYPTSNSTTLATSITICFPQSIMVDGAGQLWFTDNSVGGIASVDLATGYITSQVVGNVNGFAAPKTFGNIHTAGVGSMGVVFTTASDGLGNVYVGAFFDGTATTAYGQIIKLDPAGNISVFAGVGTPSASNSAPTDGMAATSASITSTSSMVFDSAGNCYYFDTARYMIYRIDTSGKVHPFAGSGSSAIDNAASLPYWGTGTASTTANTAINFANMGSVPGNMAVDAAGNVYFPSSPAASGSQGTNVNSRVFVFTPSGYAYVLAGSGGVAETNGAVSTAQLSFPTSVALNGTGDIYISETYGRLPGSSPAQYIGSSVRKWTMGSAAAALTFGSQAKGSTSAGQTVTATNIGNASLVLTPPASGAKNPSPTSSFTLLSNSATNACGTGTSASVAILSSCSVIVAFQPNVASGSVSGNLAFAGNVSGVTASTSLTGTATAGVASLTFTGLPANSTSGTSNTVTVSAYDGSSTLFTGYAGTVHFSLSPSDVSAALPSDYAFTGSEGGTKTFSVALSAPGSRTVTVSDAVNSLTAQQSTTVAAAVDHFVFATAAPSTTTAGMGFNVTIKAYSSADNSIVATSYTGPVVFTSTDTAAVFPTGAALNMAAGVGTYSVTLKTAGTRTIAAADSSGSPSVTSGSITVTPAAAAMVLATAGGGQSAIVGNAFTNALAVQTTDAYSNPVGGVTVALTPPASGASATLSALSCVTSATATPAGSCSVTATAIATSGGPYSVTASATGLTSATFSLTNNAKTAQTITFTQPSAQSFATTPTVAATSTSSLTVTFTSSTTGVCTVTSGGALTFVSAGTCTLNADQAGNGTYAAATTVSRSFTVNAVVPGAPTIGSATAGSQQATVTFTAPANMGGATIMGYTVTSSSGGFTGSGTASPITVTTLTNGTAYTFTVKASNSAGPGAASAASNSVTPSGVQTITFANPGTQVLGTSPTLTASASSGLAVTFTSSTAAVCTVTSAGALTLVSTGTCSINAGQAGNGTYTSAPTVTQSFAISKASQTITFTQPTTPVTYGVSALTLSATGGASGNAVTFSVVSGLGTVSGNTLTITGAGTIVVAADQAGSSNYNAATEVQRSVVVNMATPTITTAPTATAITYGQTLAASTLGGGVGSVPGNFAFATPATAPAAGTASYSATFTPTDTTDYKTATTTVSVTTNKATPTIATAPTATAITYGQTLAASTLGGGVGSVPGNFAFATPATAPAAGTASYSVTFTPTDTTDYKTATTTVSVTTNKAPPTITTAPTATAITYGQTLASSTLGGGVGSVPGSFAFTTPTTSPATGTASYSITFTPTDTTDYTVATTTVSVTTSKAMPTVTIPPTASAITYGQTLANSTLSSGVASTPGTFAFTTPTTASTAGTASYAVTFTPTDTTDYNGASTTVSVTTNLASQAINFTAPVASLTYGSATTVALNATGGASGNPVMFAATGPASVSGTTLTITGAGSISATASQAANTNYAAATAVSQLILVNKASTSLTGPATQPVFVVYQQSGTVPVSIAGQYSGTAITAPSGSITYNILNSSNTSVASGPLTIVSGSVSVPVASSLAPGLYTVTASYAGDGNYAAATTITMNLQVGMIQPVAAINAPGSTLTYGASLGIAATATYNSANVAGVFTYTATATGGSPVVVTAASALPAGAYTLTVNFTPTDAVTYKTATATSSLTVNKATVGNVSLTSSANPILVQNSTTLTAIIASSVSVPTGTVTFYDNTAAVALASNVALTGGIATLPISTLSVGTHSITAIYSGDGNFLTATSSAVSELVQDFNLTITTTGGSTSATVLPGGTASFTFNLSPMGATIFPAAVNLSVTGLPTGATYTLTPTVIASGSGTTAVALTVTVPKQTAMLHTGEKLAPIALALLLLPFAGRLRRRAHKIGRLTAMLLLLCGGALGVATLTGCGSTTGIFAQPQQTYNITITGTSGALTHSTTVTLTVQ